MNIYHILDSIPFNQTHNSGHYSCPQVKIGRIYSVSEYFVGINRRVHSCTRAALLALVSFREHGL